MSNVDFYEIDKFKKMAHQWWDKDGVCKPLHQINPLRLAFIQQHAQLENNAVLDVGCGGGILTEALAKAGATVTGIDMSEDLISVAKHHAIESKLAINYQHTTIEDFANTEQRYDAVTCMELLEHVPDPLSVIHACTHLLKPNGHLFFATINRNIKAYLFAIIGAEYLLKLLPPGTHDYQKFIRPSELDNFARQQGLNLCAMSGLGYNPLTKKYFLDTDLSVNYMVCYERSALPIAS